MSDLKKTLQRELKVQALPNDEGLENSNNLVSLHGHGHSMSMDSLNNPALIQDPRASPVPQLQTSQSSTRNMHTNKYIERQLDRASPEPGAREGRGGARTGRGGGRRGYDDDVNIVYLKHVVLKFMLSNESEVRDIHYNPYK